MFTQRYSKLVYRKYLATSWESSGQRNVDGESKSFFITDRCGCVFSRQLTV